MFAFLRNVKRAADFFSIHPDGLSFVTERRLKDLEASVSRLPKAISDRNFTSIMNLEYDIYELKQTIENLQSKLDKEQVPARLVLPAEQARTSRKHKTIKLQAVEEEVKKVKSKLTQGMVKRLLEYRNGELYWRVNRGGGVKKGDKAGYISVTQNLTCPKVTVNSNTYYVGRIVFLMFHGYLPECVSYIDGNPFNTKIENLRPATNSQINCHSRKYQNNTSGYKGVYFCKKGNNYTAQIVKRGKHYYLGTFNTAEEAHKAYCKAAKKLHGEFARVA